MEDLSRKKFVSSIVVASGFIFLPKLGSARLSSQKSDPLDKELVKQFVIAAHVDQDKTKKMVEENPDLLNAVHNLNTWDWEDALGAAGHMGHRELAKFLLEKGARMTICVAAMLGELEIVQATIKAFPYMKYAVGPHKISLLSHAKFGGDPATPVVEYLNSIGITN